MPSGSGSRFPPSTTGRAAAGTWLSRAMVPLSNLRGTGPWQVGTPRAVSVVGASDMAGNVREWCYNEEAASGERYILGGGWSDPTYAFVDAYAQPPMDRSAINGIRLVRYDPADSNVAVARRPTPRAFTDYAKVPSVSGCGIRGLSPPVRLRSACRSNREDRARRFQQRRLECRVRELHRRVRRRADGGVGLPAREAARRRTSPWCSFPGSGAINTRTSATTARHDAELRGEERPRVRAADLQEHLRTGGHADERHPRQVDLLARSRGDVGEGLPAHPRLPRAAARTWTAPGSPTSATVGAATWAGSFRRSNRGSRRRCSTSPASPWSGRGPRSIRSITCRTSTCRSSC